jgi:hypothetical protein
LNSIRAVRENEAKNSVNCNEVRKELYVLYLQSKALLGKPTVVTQTRAFEAPLEYRALSAAGTPVPTGSLTGHRGTTVKSNDSAYYVSAAPSLV